MTRPVETTIRRLLGEIAPEVDIDAVPRDASLREALEIDSMDLLHFAIALGKELGIDIPERDYPRLATIAACAEYVDDAPRRP